MFKPYPKYVLPFCAEHHKLASSFKYVRRSELTTIKMVASNEKKFSRVIDDGVIKNWVGIGWVTERNAKVADYKKFPVVLPS